VYKRQGYLKDGHAWYAGGARDDTSCAIEWLFYDPDPGRDGSVPGQWVFWNTQRAPWARGEPKSKPQWDNREYKRPPDQDYHRNAFVVNSSPYKGPPLKATWHVNCAEEINQWGETEIELIAG